MRSVNTTGILSLRCTVFRRPAVSCKKSCGHWGPMIDSAPNLAKSFSSAVKFLRNLILQRWNIFSILRGGELVTRLVPRTATPIAVVHKRCGFLNFVSLNYFVTGR